MSLHFNIVYLTKRKSGTRGHICKILPTLPPLCTCLLTGLANLHKTVFMLLFPESLLHF